MNLQPPFSNLVVKIRKKTTSRKHPCKVLRLLFTNLLDQSTEAASSSSTPSPPPSALVSPSLTSFGAPAQAATSLLAVPPMPLAPTLLGGDAGVNESAPPGSSARPLIQPVSSALELVIELSDKDEQKARPRRWVVPLLPWSSPLPHHLRCLRRPRHP
jgi:hypothetical protein